MKWMVWNRHICVAILIVCGSKVFTKASVPTTAATDAVDLYQQALRSIAAESPSDSNLIYPEYPPFGVEWDRMEAQAFGKEGPARSLVHEARAITAEAWPSDDEKPLLNSCRQLANHIGDAALYQHLNGDDAAAVETIRDLIHLSALVRQDSPPNDFLRPLTAAGVDALISVRVMIIASGVKMTTEANDTRSLQIATAHGLVNELLNLPAPEKRMAIFAAAGLKNPDPSVRVDLLKETFARCNAARITAAMSIACHIFQFEKHRWPKSLEELVPAYLPSPPADYWGNGKQSFGYVLINNGLPDGSDRPLEYDRCESADGLFFRTDEPEYSFYVGDGSNLPRAQQKRGGQFYDVAAWKPRPRVNEAPTTQSLQSNATN